MEVGSLFRELGLLAYQYQVELEACHRHRTFEERKSCVHPRRTAMIYSPTIKNAYHKEDTNGRAELKVEGFAIVKTL